MRGKAVYPVDYRYARAILIMHKPWSKTKLLTDLLSDKDRTIYTFERMILKNQLPLSIVAQYITSMKYTYQKS